MGYNFVMALYHFHRVLIAAGVLFFLGYGLYAFDHFDADHRYNLPIGIVSSFAAAGLVAYLIYFNRKVRRLRDAGK